MSAVHMIAGLAIAGAVLAGLEGKRSIMIFGAAVWFGAHLALWMR